MLKKYLEPVIGLSKKYKFSVMLPGLYAVGLIFGFSLSMIQAFFLPELTKCFLLGGSRLCSSWGVIVTLVANLPGYILFARIGDFIEISKNLSMMGVMLSSFGIYYLTGKITDKIIKDGFETGALTRNIILASFFILGYLLFVFL